MPNNQSIGERISYFITEKTRFKWFLLIIIILILVINLWMLKASVKIPGTDSEINALWLVMILAAIAFYIIAQTDKMIEDYTRAEETREAEERIVEIKEEEKEITEEKPEIEETENTNFKPSENMNKFFER